MISDDVIYARILLSVSECLIIWAMNNVALGNVSWPNGIDRISGDKIKRVVSMLIRAHRTFCRSIASNPTRLEAIQF